MNIKTKKITNLPLNYEKNFSIKRNIEFVEINNTENIIDIYIPIEVNYYLINRALLAINNSGFNFYGLILNAGSYIYSVSI